MVGIFDVVLRVLEVLQVENLFGQDSLYCCMYLLGYCCVLMVFSFVEKFVQFIFGIIGGGIIGGWLQKLEVSICSGWFIIGGGMVLCVNGIFWLSEGF